MHDAPIRELFIDELAQVHGGGPVEDVIDLIERIKPAPVEPGGGIISDPPIYTTLACGEEAGSGC